MIIFIYACDLNGAIGKDGDLPWRQSSIYNISRELH